MSELTKAIDDLNGSIDSWKATGEKKIAELNERIELLEAGTDRPTKTAANAKLGYKVFHTEHGEIFDLPNSVKMADVLPPEKQPEISLERWLAATVAGERCGDKEAVQYAREQKQIVTTSTGVLIPAEYQSEWIDLLRAAMVLNKAGARTVTMDAKTQVHSAIATDPAANWHTEAGSISANNPTFAARTLSAKTLVTRCQASVELAQDSPDFGGQLAKVITGAMAAELDRAGLHGSGAPAPAGILGTSGIKQVTSVGTITDYAELVDGVKKLLESNVPLEVAAKYAIMSPRTWAVYENLVTGISSDKTPLARPRSLEAMEFLVTNNVSNTIGSPQRSVIFLGDFSNLLMGIRREASVEILKLDTYAGNLLLEIVGYCRADFVLTRPAAFCTLEQVAG